MCMLIGCVYKKNQVSSTSLEWLVVYKSCSVLCAQSQPHLNNVCDWTVSEGFGLEFRRGELETHDTKQGQVWFQVKPWWVAISNNLQINHLKTEFLSHENFVSNLEIKCAFRIFQRVFNHLKAYMLHSKFDQNLLGHLTLLALNRIWSLCN